MALNGLSCAQLTLLLKRAGMQGNALLALRGGYSSTSLWCSTLQVLPYRLGSMWANPLRSIVDYQCLSNLCADKDVLLDLSNSATSEHICVLVALARCDFLVLFFATFSSVELNRDEEGTLVLKYSVQDQAGLLSGSICIGSQGHMSLVHGSAPIMRSLSAISNSRRQVVDYLIILYEDHACSLNGGLCEWLWAWALMSPMISAMSARGSALSWDSERGDALSWSKQSKSASSVMLSFCNSAASSLLYFEFVCPFADGSVRPLFRQFVNLFDRAALERDSESHEALHSEVSPPMRFMELIRLFQTSSSTLRHGEYTGPSLTRLLDSIAEPLGVTIWEALWNFVESGLKASEAIWRQDFTSPTVWLGVPVIDEALRTWVSTTTVSPGRGKLSDDAFNESLVSTGSSCQLASWTWPIASSGPMPAPLVWEALPDPQGRYEILFDVSSGSSTSS